MIRPARPDYVPEGAHYAGPILDTAGKVRRLSLWFGLAAAAWLILAVIVGLIIWTTPHGGAVPDRGVTPVPNPGVTMPATKYSAPVIPGPAGARRAPIARTAAAAARPGQPGHLEKLITTPGAVWSIADRASALQR